MPRKYTKVEELKEIVFERKANGETNQKIGESLGLTKKQVKELGSYRSAYEFLQHIDEEASKRVGFKREEKRAEDCSRLHDSAKRSAKERWSNRGSTQEQ